MFSKFCKVNRKIPVPESLFNEAPGFEPVTFLEERLQHGCLPVSFVLTEHLWATASVRKRGPTISIERVLYALRPLETFQTSKLELSEPF